jgi:hypothetical protein
LAPFNQEKGGCLTGSYLPLTRSCVGDNIAFFVFDEFILWLNSKTTNRVAALLKAKSEGP